MPLQEDLAGVQDMLSRGTVILYMATMIPPLEYSLHTTKLHLICLKSIHRLCCLPTLKCIFPVLPLGCLANPNAHDNGRFQAP